MTRKNITTIFALFGALLYSTPSPSAEPYVKKELTQIIRDFDQSQPSKKMLRAIENLLSAVVVKLQSEGDFDFAESLSKEWTQLLVANSGQFSNLDLGDHVPLNQWLADVYSRIEAKLTARVCHWLRFDDLKIFNYAIPVVFNPKGLNGDKWDLHEYRKHFTPFSGAVTYWTVSGACQASTSGLISWVCGTIAEAPRYAMEKWIAPRLSDRVYLSNTSGELTHPASEIPTDLDRLLTEAENQ